MIALPEDMLTSLTDRAPITAPAEIIEAAPSPAAMQRLRALLAGAERPVILYGGCNWAEGSAARLQAFAEASDIPVVSVFRYQDQYDNASPTFCGEAGVGMVASVKELLREADIILAINNRFGENSTDGYTLFDVPQPRQKIIHVHGSDLEIGKVYRPELGIHAGPNAFAEALEALEP